MGIMHFDEIESILPVLKAGGMILYPTDTIWGIGCDARDEAAVRKVFELKKRPISKSFVLLVSSQEMLSKYVPYIHPRISNLTHYHERPVTVIYDNPMGLPPLVVSDDNTIAIRLVKDPFCQALVEAFGAPLIATSANISNEPFPANFTEVSEPIVKGVDYVVRHRQNDMSKNQPSAIVKAGKNNELEFIRE